MARIRIDWQRIRQLPAEDVLVLLDRQAAGVLLSIMHIFEWQALFRVDDYDYADWDYLQEILSSAEEAIGNPLRLADLIPELQNIAASIDSLYCCDVNPIDPTNGDQFTDTVVEDETNGVPQNIVDAGYATTTDDWDGYYDYKCMVANLLLDSAINKCQSLEELVEVGGSFLGLLGAIGVIIGSIFTSGGLLIIAGVATALGATTALYDDIVAGTLGFFDGIAADLQANRDDIIEALYCGDGPSGAYADFLAAADAVLNPAESAALRALNLEADLKAFYGGRYNQTDVADRLSTLGYDVSDYTCSCTDPNEFDKTFNFLSDEENWIDGGTGTAVWVDTYGDPIGCLYFQNNNQTDSTWVIDGNVLAAALGISIPTSFTIYELHFVFKILVQGAHTGKAWIAQNNVWSEGFAEGETVDVWHQLDFTGYSEVVTDMNAQIVKTFHEGSSSTQYGFFIDTVRIVGRHD